MVTRLKIADQIFSLEDVDYLVLAGPTAVGKTDLVNSIQEQVAIEVISADTRQVYRGMNIGTATPDDGLLKAIPHHFINELDPDTVWSAGSFYRQARERIGEILERGRLPLVVGGAGLYLEALRHGLFEASRSSPEIRLRYERRLAEIGAQALWQELHAIDPVYAETFSSNDHKKLVRAMEIYAETGMPPSEAFQTGQSEFEQRDLFLVLSRPREVLYQRINERVEQMLADGLVQECQLLLTNGFGPELYPLRTIGYKEVFSFLAGDINEGELCALIQKNTRNFAKRQLTWFRNHAHHHWLELE